MDIVIASLAGLFVGGTFGVLVAALAAASKRATELEAMLEPEQPEPGVFLLEPREPLTEEESRHIAQSFEQQTGNRVIILDAYRVDDFQEEED